PYISSVSAGFKIFGSYLWIPYAVSALYISLANAVIVLLSCRLFSPKIGIIAGLLLALCGVFIYYSGLTVKSSFVIFGTSLVLYLGVVAIHEKSYRAFIASIFAMAITSYDRDN